MLLYLCNTMPLEYVETGALLEFGELQRKVERGELITTTPDWVELQTQKKNRMSKSESGRGSGGVAPGQQSKREEERKSDVDSRLRMMERFQEFSSH